MAVKEKYYLKCKNTNCEHAIVLPLPILRENEPRLLLWPWDGKPRNFLCSDCWHAYEYTLHEVQSRFDGTLDRFPPIDTVFAIETRCGIGNCGLPAKILVTGNSGMTALAPPSGWFDHRKSGCVRCEGQHLTERLIPEIPKIDKDQTWV
jgi:hypothetical protein